MKFSIVTPVFNGEKFISETIESILSQEGDFEIEYIVMDGASTDKTLEIVASFEKRLRDNEYPVRCKKISMRYFSEKDDGIFFAINKGFSLATGDIYAWLGADDTYLPGSLDITAKTFLRYQQIEWLSGINSTINESSQVTRINPCYIYNQKWIQMGIYGRNAYFIYADSVFWRAELWKKSGEIKNSLRYAGDYYLWLQFAKYTPLYSLNKEVSCFRKRAGQLSENMGKYRQEQASLSQEHGVLNFKVKLFFWLKQHLPQNSFTPFFLLLYKTFFRNRQTTYIDVDEKGEPFINETRSYICPKKEQQ